MTNGRRHSPLRVASLGLGNWAGRIADLLVQQNHRASPDVRLISVFELDLAAHAARAAAVRSAGVRLADSFASVLADERVEAVLLPVPIHLHRPLTEQALAAGKPVLVEKPAAGCVQDVDAMIAARDRAGLPVLVSFQDTCDPAILKLKRMILDGAIGKVTSATVLGCWPRGEAYYRRAPWAGRLQFEDAWVLDSPVTNAFAHYLNLTFFLLGCDERTWATPQSVESELYRANPIENYDTASLRYRVNGVPMLVLLTHACRTSLGPIVQVNGDRGSIRINLEAKCAVAENEKGVCTVPLAKDPRECAFAALAQTVRGDTVSGVPTTLEGARLHVIATNGASQCALVRRIPEDQQQVFHSSEGERCRAVTGIESVLSACADRNMTLHESGQVGWSTPPGRMSLEHYSAFTGCPEQSVFVENVSSLSHSPSKLASTAEVIDVR